MTRIKRPAAAVGAAVLLGFSLSACGGPPTDASKDDYCEVVNDSSAFEDVEQDDTEAFVDALKEWADDVKEVGTPEDIPDDAREGYEIQLDAIEDLDADDFDDVEDLDQIEEDMSDDEQEKVDAYTEYENETCADESEGE